MRVSKAKPHTIEDLEKPHTIEDLEKDSAEPPPELEHVGYTVSVPRPSAPPDEKAGARGRNPSEEYELWKRDWAMFEELGARVVQVPIDKNGRRLVDLPAAPATWAMQYRILLDPKSSIAAAARVVSRLKCNGGWQSLNAAFKARNPVLVDPGTGERYRLLPRTPAVSLKKARWIDLPATLQLHADTIDLKRMATAKEHLDAPEGDLRAIMRGEAMDGRLFLALSTERRAWVLAFMEIRRFLALPLKRLLGDKWTPERWAQFKRDIAR